MRIEQIDVNKIRVFITNDDMERLNIDAQKLAPNSPELSKCIFKIIEHVKNQTGFNPNSAKMIIEAVHSLDGLMLMLTKSDDDGFINTAAENLRENKPSLNKNLNKSKIKNVRAKKKISLPEFIIYEFSGAQNFFAAVKSAEKEWLQISSVYRNEDKYYIMFKEKNDKYMAYLSEFASGGGYKPLFGTFLKEHADFVAEGDDLVHIAKEIHNFY